MTNYFFEISVPRTNTIDLPMSQGIKRRTTRAWNIVVRVMPAGHSDLTRKSRLYFFEFTLPKKNFLFEK